MSDKFRVYEYRNLDDLGKYNRYKEALLACADDRDKFDAWLTYQFALATTDLEYCDNFRVAKVGDAEQEARYDEARRDGCCGFCDITRNYRGEAYRLGFNYGH